MKPQRFRLMKVFEIESSYQKHKNRLLSIQNFDAKRKVSTSTTKNAEVINSYKKNRLTHDIFNEKEKVNRMRDQNNKLH